MKLVPSFDGKVLEHRRSWWRKLLAKRKPTLAAKLMQVHMAGAHKPGRLV